MTTDRQPTFGHVVSWLAGCHTLPNDVERKARLLLLDTFGCLVAGLAHREVKQFGQALATAFPGEVAWPGSDLCLAPAGSAALGAAAVCWDEACEGLASAHGRPALPVIPALLALAARGDASLGQVLLALATGYEIGARAGQAWRIPEGWHVDGSWHAIGAAAAVARLTSGPGAIQPAIEAAATQIPASLYLPILSGSFVRNTYPSHAALLGILAAAAAAAHYEMPSGALEEARCRVLRTNEPLAVAPAGEWTILQGYLKPYAGVRHTHYGVDAALRIRSRPDFSPTKVRAIALTTYEEAALYCGNRAPRTVIQAQFSLSYAVAAALVLGDLGPDAYADALHDPEIAGLEHMVSIQVDSCRTRRGADLVVNLSEGGETKTYDETVDVVAGDPERPMTADQVVGKFIRYAEARLGRQTAERLAAFFLHGDAQESARTCFLLSSRC